MKLTKKIVSLALAAAMTAGMVSGCGGGSSSKIPGSEAAGAEASSEAAGSEAAGSEAAGGGREAGGTCRGAPGGEGSLTIAIPQVHNTFFMPQSTTTSDRFGAQPVLESLGRADEEGNYYPWLAEEFITDPDKLTFTIKLREGVNFTDGSPCDAEAVALEHPAVY